LSANELALLPFEIANAPQGFVGAGQSLLLQSQAPVCITREVRRVAAEESAQEDLRPPRILMAAASPHAPVPLEAHVVALRQAIEPWMWSASARSKPLQESIRERVAEHLTVLPQASIRQIEDECSSGQYTHVHILAHGVALKKNNQRY